MLTLRVARMEARSAQDLVVSGLAPQEILGYLSALVKSGEATLLIAGEVGTGKTTLVRALASAIAEDEAILIIEDTHEIALSRAFTRTLLTREANTEGAGRISPADAIRAGMRMAMNRVILGEMRDGEAAEAFIDVCASGHPGMSTLHAKSARDALGRLELLLMRAQGGVSVETARRQIANAVSVVVFLATDRKHGGRRIVEVLEVGSAADGAIQVSPIFEYDASQSVPSWRRQNGISLFSKLLKEQNVQLSLPRERLHCEATSTRLEQE